MGRGYVAWVQSALNQIMGTLLKVDGIMGPKTRGIVRSFQQARGLKVDGIVGPKTEDVLRAAGAPPLPWEEPEEPVESKLGALVSTPGCAGLSGVKPHLFWFELWLNSCQADSLGRVATATTGVGTPICLAVTLATAALGGLACSALVGTLAAEAAIIAAVNAFHGFRGVKVFFAFVPSGGATPIITPPFIPTPLGGFVLFAIFSQ
jgi:hypothetical protein